MPQSSSSVSSHSNDNPSTESGSFEDNSEPVFFSQAALNDLIRNLDLPKSKAAILGQALYDRKLLGPDCVFSCYRDRQKSYVEFFAEEDQITYCKDIE